MDSIERKFYLFCRNIWLINDTYLLLIIINIEDWLFNTEIHATSNNVDMNRKCKTKLFSKNMRYVYWNKMHKYVICNNKAMNKDTQITWST